MTEANFDRLERNAEQRVRRQARDLGFTLIKSKARNPLDVTYGGFMLAMDGVSVAGGEGPGFMFDLDDIADYLDHYEDGAA